MSSIEAFRTPGYAALADLGIACRTEARSVRAFKKPGATIARVGIDDGSETSVALLRILLAMYLALWSPAMCCCGVKALLGRVTGVAVARCGEAREAPVSLDENACAETAERGCCARKGVSLEKLDVQDALLDGRTVPDPSETCRCHESLASKVRLDTGAKILLPAIAKVAFSIALVPAFPAVVNPPIAMATVRVDQRSGRPPPLATLLAQRCLLLI